VANLQIKGIDDGLYEELKGMAAREGRSMSQQVLFLVKEYLARKHHMARVKTPAETLLELSGSWSDDREAEEIIANIKDVRRNSRKLQEGF
jgi:plasmid stability protein